MPDLSRLFRGRLGYDPNNPIDEQHPEITDTRRAEIMSLTGGNHDVAKRTLEKDGFEVVEIGGPYDFALKKEGGLYHRFDETAATYKDLTDVAGGAFTTGASLVSGLATAAFTKNPAATMSASASGGAFAEGLLTEFGKRRGIEFEDNEQRNAIATEGLYGLLGEGVGQAAGLATKAAARHAYRGVGRAKENIAGALTMDAATSQKVAREATEEGRKQAASELRQRKIVEIRNEIGLIDRQLALPLTKGEKLKKLSARRAVLEEMIPKDGDFILQKQRSKLVKEISEIREDTYAYGKSRKSVQKELRELRAHRKALDKLPAADRRGVHPQSPNKEVMAKRRSDIRSIDKAIGELLSENTKEAKIALREAKIGQIDRQLGPRVRDVASDTEGLARAQYGNQGPLGDIATKVTAGRAKKIIGDGRSVAEQVASGDRLNIRDLRDLATKEGFRKAMPVEQAGGKVLNSWDRAAIEAELIDLYPTWVVPSLAEGGAAQTAARFARGGYWGAPLQASRAGKLVGKGAEFLAQGVDAASYLAGKIPSVSTAAAGGAAVHYGSLGMVPVNFIGHAVLTAMAARGITNVAPRTSYVLRQMANDRGALVASMLKAATLPQPLVRAAKQTLQALSSRGELAYKASLYMLMQKPEFRSWLQEQVGGEDAPQKQDEEAERPYTSDTKAFAY